MFALAIVLYALTRTGSPVLAGWLAFAAVAPGLLVSPIAGALIDSVGSVWAITVDMAAGAVCITALIAIDRLGWTNTLVLLTLTGLFSLTRPLSMAGIRTLLPRLVAVHALDRANALDTAINGLTDILGPALAGAIMGFSGPTLTLGTIAIAYVIAAFSAGSIPQARGQLPTLGPLLAQAWSGLRRVLQRPTLRGLAVAYSLYEIAWGILIVAVPLFAAQRFAGGTGSAVAGLLWASLGLVGGISALIAGHRRTAGRERVIMALGMLVTTVAIWPIAAEFGVLGLLLGLMIIGAAAGAIDVGVLTLRQRRTDPAELGRVVSISMSLNMAGGPLGSALGGVLATWSLSAALVVAALASLLASAAVGLIPRADDHVAARRAP